MVFELFKVDMVLYFRFTRIEEIIIDCKYIIFYVSPSLECNEGYCWESWNKQHIATDQSQGCSRQAGPVNQGVYMKLQVLREIWQRESFLSRPITLCEGHVATALFESLFSTCPRSSDNW